MNITIISASMRAGSQSLKVSKWLENHLQSIGQMAIVIDLHKEKLPGFDAGETSVKNISGILNKFEETDGFIFVSPEWDGMMSHGLISLLHYVRHQMADKPVMLVGVSAGRGGTYPLAQMRLMGYKNKHFVISPESLIMQGVNGVFNDHSFDEGVSDLYIKKRADYALKVLVEYAKALKHVRESGVIDIERYANGM